MTEKVNPWKLSEQNKNIMKYIPAWSSHEQQILILTQAKRIFIHYEM